jgi:hypothetical protein
MRIAPPDVFLEVRPLVDDPEGEGIAFDRRYVARLWRRAPSAALLWSTETDHVAPEAARSDMLADIQRCLDFEARAAQKRFRHRIRANARGRVGPAPDPGIVLDEVIRSIQVTMPKWSPDQGLSLALELIFPTTLAELDLAPQWNAKGGRGRPVVVDRQTARIYQLMSGWARATGYQARLGRHSTFVRVVEEIAPPLHLNPRGKKSALRSVCDALRAEQAKLLSERLSWAKTPSVLHELTPPIRE